MRVAILLLGLFGAGSACAAGVYCLLANVLASEAKLGLPKLSDNLSASQKVTLRQLADSSSQTLPFFFLSAGLGFIGGIMGAMGHTKSAGILLLTAALGPPLIALGSPMMLDGPMYGGLSMFALGGILGLVASKKKPDDDEDDDDPDDDY